MLIGLFGTPGVFGCSSSSPRFHLILFLTTDPGQAPAAAPAAAAPPAPSTAAPSAAPAAAGRATAENIQPGARRMVAIFDYDPRESSPNTDIEVGYVHPVGPRLILSTIFIGCLLFFFAGGAHLQCWRHHTRVW